MNSTNLETAGAGAAFVTRNESRVRVYVLRSTFSALGTTPLSDTALIYPPLCSTTVVVVIPMAPIVPASSFAMSPDLGITLTPPGILTELLEDFGARVTSVPGLTRHVLVWYFARLSMANLIYGSMAAVIVVLLPLEVAAVILLLGAQVIAEIDRARRPSREIAGATGTSG